VIRLPVIGFRRAFYTGPEPLPHPDEVVNDYRTGEVRIEGPVLEETTNNC
jgi:hypothetical protein